MQPVLGDQRQVHCQQCERFIIIALNRPLLLQSVSFAHSVKGVCILKKQDLVSLLDTIIAFSFVIQIKNLPSPYGDCEEKDPVPVSRCKMKCKTQTLVELCGCRDVYMTPHVSNGCEFEITIIRRLIH